MAWFTFCVAQESTSFLLQLTMTNGKDKRTWLEIYHGSYVVPWYGPGPAP
jgi:hypothetical protein